MSENEFWVVWEPTHGNPQFRHADQHTARNEAQRLARANPGRRFYTLRAVEVFEAVDVVSHVLGPAIPF